MQIYPASAGFGNVGLAVTDVGRVYRFPKPITKIILWPNDQSNTVYLGFNEDIVGAVENAITGGPADERDRIGAITAAEALAKGLPVEVGDWVEYDCPIDATHGRRGIYCIWAICAPGEAATIFGGVSGM